MQSWEGAREGEWTWKELEWMVNMIKILYDCMKISQVLIQHSIEKGEIVIYITDFCRKVLVVYFPCLKDLVYQQ